MRDWVTTNFDFIDSIFLRQAAQLQESDDILSEKSDRSTKQ
jgi:hypothetical protein